MFASTNLAIELGVLILIFLGWKFPAAEVVGGLILIGISSLLIKLAYPKSWFKEARKMIEKQADDEESDFDWRQRIRSREGWNLVGHQPETRHCNVVFIPITRRYRAFFISSG